MRYDNVLDYLTNEIEEQRTVVAKTVLAGNITEPEYRRLAGVIQGLDYSKQLIKDLAKRLETDADE